VFAGTVGLEHPADGYRPFALAGVNFGHIRAFDGIKPSHSGWSGLFPSWMVRNAIDDWWQKSHVH
jgi:hypothetical protein